jgi:hypothetical protein
MRAAALRRNSWTGSQYDAAIETYEGGLKGIFEHDPTLLLGVARAQFAKKNYRGRAGGARTPDSAQSGLQVLRRGSFCTHARSRSRVHSRRLCMNTRRSRPAIPARKRAFVYGLLLKRLGRLR